MWGTYTAVHWPRGDTLVLSSRSPITVVIYLYARASNCFWCPELVVTAGKLLDPAVHPSDDQLIFCTVQINGDGLCSVAVYIHALRIRNS